MNDSRKTEVQKLDNVINFEDARKRNIARKKNVSDIREEIKNKNYSLAVGIVFPSDGSEPEILCNADINPLEAAGILMKMANNLTRDVKVNTEE